MAKCCRWPDLQKMSTKSGPGDLWRQFGLRVKVAHCNLLASLDCAVLFEHNLFWVGNTQDPVELETWNYVYIYLYMYIYKVSTHSFSTFYQPSGRICTHGRLPSRSTISTLEVRQEQAS